MVESDNAKLSVRSQCRLLSLSRSSYYLKPKGESAENLALMKHIDKIYLSYAYFGSRRMTYVLKQEGHHVHSHEAGIYVSDGHHGLALTQGFELETLEHFGCPVLCRGS